MRYERASDMIGNTPLLVLNQFMRKEGLSATIFGKLEYLNPAGSVKDRAALAMIEAAEEKGLLRPGSTIIEPTSGNTGIGLASVAAARGYKTILTMPDSMSTERRRLLAAYGAELVLTPGDQGMQGAVDKAIALQKTISGSFIPGQFENPAYPEAHEKITGPELWKDTEGQIDIFVAGVGTGGTITGCGRFLKRHNSHIQIVAVEPASSPMLSGGKAGKHGLQGIGANFIPKNYDPSVVDEIIPVTEEEAYAAARKLGKAEGILAGISSGAALHAAVLLANRPKNRGKNIVVLLPDGGDRYLSTPLFE